MALAPVATAHTLPIASVASSTQHSTVNPVGGAALNVSAPFAIVYCARCWYTPPMKISAGFTEVNAEMLYVRPAPVVNVNEWHATLLPLDLTTVMPNTSMSKPTGGGADKVTVEPS